MIGEAIRMHSNSYLTCDSKVVAAWVWILTTGPRSFQNYQALEASRTTRVSTCLCLNKGPDNLFRRVSQTQLNIESDLTFSFRVICIVVFAIAEVKTATSQALAAVINYLGSVTLLCVLGSRMFFNLKEAAEHGVNVGTNWASYSHSAIHFDESPTREGR